MTYAYFIFILFIGIAPIIGTKLYRHSLSPQLPTGLLSISLCAMPYLLWDMLVTDIFWSFNHAYTLGVKIYNLPLEEVLFFFVVPYAMLVLWVNFNHRLTQVGTPSWLTPFLIVLFSILSLLALSFEWWYTFVALVSCLIVIILGQFLTPHLLRSRTLYSFLIITAIFTTIFNNYLTGLPIVLYNSQFISNLRIVTMPIEDALYGLTLIGLNIFLYEKLKFNRK